MVSRVYKADELEVCEQVGKGAFGVVYRGLIKATNEEVAIKQIDLENEEADLFEINKEIQIISECRLSQITKYMGCFVKNYKLWVIMEFVNGGSLFELLMPGPVNDEKLILIIAKEILIALEYLHNQGKIHRDLKSQNILLSSNGEVKLTDFGVSTQLSSNFSRRNTTVGTPYWMAPEVILNNNGGHDNKADIWSLGCCLFELFCGKPPLQTHYSPMKALRYISRCYKNEDFLDLIELDSMKLSDNFKDFLVKCFIIDPRERFSATRLLKHKFISKNNYIESECQKLIKGLITRKKLYDQENHVLKTQNFYLPTEMINNQRKWNGGNENVYGVDEDEEETIKFDISTINYGDNDADIVNARVNGYPSPKSTTRESSISPPTTSFNKAVDGLSPKKNPHQLSSSSSSLVSTSNQVNFSQASRRQNLISNLQPELKKILNKVFHKLESKNNLSTEQYDSLVNLNDNMLNLLAFSGYDYSNPSSSQKILICQYMKYFLKELMKVDNFNSSKLYLQKIILPSDLKEKSDNLDTLSVPKKNPGPFDDIENSLFETWIDEMKRNP